MRGADAENKSAKGAYILKDCAGKAKVTIFATGSEIEIALAAAEKLGDGVRVVSVPCMDLFFEQPKEYIDSLIFNDSIKVGIEAAIRFGWDSIIGRDGIFIGMKSFGELRACRNPLQTFRHYRRSGCRGGFGETEISQNCVSFHTLRHCEELGDAAIHGLLRWRSQ